MFLISTMQRRVDDVRTISAPCMLQQLVSKRRNYPRPLVSESVFQSTFNHMVTILMSSKLIDLDEELVHKLRRGSITCGPLQQATKDTTTILVACQLQACLTDLLHNKRRL